MGTQAMDDPVLHSGYLLRINDRGAGLITYVKLRSSGLMAFYNSHTEACKGSKDYLILIGSATISTDCLVATGGTSGTPSKGGTSGTPNKGSTPSKGSSLRFNFKITTSHDAVSFCAKTKVEMDKWTAAIQLAIQQSSLSNYIYVKRTGGFLFSSSSKKFFVLEQKQLKQFKDHNNLTIPEQIMSLDEHVVVEKINDVKMKLRLSNSRDNITFCLQFPRKKDRHEYLLWKENLLFLLLKVKEQTKETLGRISRIFESNIKIDYNIKLRNNSTEGAFISVIAILSSEKELWLLDENMSATQPDASLIIERIDLSRDMFALPTSLAHHSFQLVTSQKILHFSCAEQTHIDVWLGALRQAISSARIDLSDPLLLQAVDRAAKDEFYEIQINDTSRSLGLQFERARESVLVKTSRHENTGVHEGSILHAINGEACFDLPYESAIAKLVNWRPPLMLKFRKSPELSGCLNKRCRVSKNGVVSVVWKAKHVSVARGRVAIQDKGAAAGKTATLSLIGTSVTLLGPKQTGRFYCFQVNYGTEVMVLQASSVEEMNEWTATLYHAQALANGGFHITNGEEIQSLRASGQGCFVYSNSNSNSPVDNVSGSPPADTNSTTTVCTPQSSPCATKLQLVNEYSSDSEEGEDRNVAAIVVAAAAEVNARVAVEAQVQQEEEEGEEEGVRARVRVEAAELTAIADAANSIVRAAVMAAAAAPKANASPPSSCRSPATPLSPLPLRHTSCSGNINADTPANKGWSLPAPPSPHSSSAALPLASSDASDLDIRQLFHTFAHSSSTDGSAATGKEAYMNPMNMSAFLRVLSGDRGNLFKEMVTFDNFSSKKNALIDENDFLSGWRKEALRDDRLLRRLKYVASNSSSATAAFNASTSSSSSHIYSGLENDENTVPN